VSTADPTLVLGLSLTVAWAVAALVALLRRRVRGRSLAVLVLAGVAVVAFTLFAGVVDAVADTAAGPGATRCRPGTPWARS
jgi:predicted PurR-regulated permease PerM